MYDAVGHLALTSDRVRTAIQRELINEKHSSCIHRTVTILVKRFVTTYKLRKQSLETNLEKILHYIFNKINCMLPVIEIMICSRGGLNLLLHLVIANTFLNNLNGNFNFVEAQRRTFVRSFSL